MEGAGMMEEFVKEAANLINSIGFPIFVAVFVLARLEPVIVRVADRFDAATNRLSDNLRLLSILVARQQGLSDDEVRKIEEQYGIRRDK